MAKCRHELGGERVECSGSSPGVRASSLDYFCAFFWSLWNPLFLDLGEDGDTWWTATTRSAFRLRLGLVGDR